MATTNSLKTANQLLQAGKLDDARQEYQKLIELKPNFSWNYYYLGELLAQEHKWPDAIANYKRAIELNPNSAHLCNSLAEALIQHGELDEAINSSKKAVSLQPYWAIYHQTLALAYEAKLNFGQALTTWQKILSLNPSHLRATQKISWLQTDVARDCVESGEKLNKEGKIEEAVEYYQKALIMNPQQPIHIYRNCGNNLITLGRFEEAENVFERLIKLYPEVPDGYELYAVVTHHLPDWELALKRWSEAIVKFPENIIFQVNKGNALINLSQLDEAETIFKQLKEKYPNQPQGYEGYARLTHHLPDWKLALKRWSEGIIKFPENLYFKFQKGNALINLSRFDEAEAVFKELIEKYPNQELGYEGYGRLIHHLADWELALKLWSEAILKFPERISFQVQKGNALINLSRYDEAEAVFQQLKEKYPNQPQGYNGYARVAQNLEDWELALSRWENAISQLPDSLNFRFQKGNILINLSRFDEAEAVFQEIIQKYPRHYHGYDGYGRVANNLPDWELALERWEDAIAKLPNHFNFYLRKGDVLINLFRYEEAETWWEKVIARYPDRHEGLSKSAFLARQLGNREFAWQRFEQAIEKFPWHLAAYCEAAKELMAMGRFAEAEEKFQQALHKDPKHFTALLQGGILASQQGYRELALERFERIIEYYPPQKVIDAYILAATELKYLGRESEAITKYEQIITFHRQQDLYPEVKLLGTSLTSTQELGLLLDRLTTKQPDRVEDVISLARLTERTLFVPNPPVWPNYASIAKDAPSLLPKLRILKELLSQYLVGRNDRNERDLLLVLSRFEVAIKILEKESQILNNSEWERVKLVRLQIPLPLTDKLCFESLSSSARYVMGEDERVPKSQIQATVKYLPELMDRDKEYFEAHGRKLANSFKLKSRQTIDVYKDFICKPPYGISERYIFNRYAIQISEKFVQEFINENTNSSREMASLDELYNLMVDIRPTLDETAIKKTALDNYYEDDVIFGLPVVGNYWGSYQNYGHLLFDQIPSLILYQKLNLSCKIFVPHITDSHWEIFRHLNIPKEKILVKQEQKFKYLIFCRYQKDVEAIHFYRKLRESIVAKRGDIPSEYRARYVYISRRYSEIRAIANEVEVEELMASLGFSIVYAERLSFEEKALLMNHASFVVGQHGAGFSNCVMCRPDTTIVEIFPEPKWPYYYYFLWVLGKYKFYPLYLDKTIRGLEMNIDKLKKVITTILEGE